MTDLVKRLRYFNGQFLRGPDFTAEQDYHVQHQRDHMRLLHTAGIAAGLEVPDPPAGATAVTVNAGVAYDGQGQRIVLANNQSLELADVAPGQAVFVTIAYGETETDPTDETGVSGNTRWTEQPLIEKLAAAPANPSEKLVLARILRNGTTIASIDRSQRRAAGVKGGDMQAPSLTLTSNAINPSGWLTMNLGASGRADVIGDLRVTGNLMVQGETTVVSTERMQGNVVLGDADNDTVTVEGNLVTGHSSGRLKIGSPTDIAGNLTLTGPVTVPANGLAVGTGQLVAAAGNVGIGTTNPSAKLHVGGSEATADGFNAAITLENTAANGRKWYLRSGATGTATPAGGMSIGDDAAYRLVIKSDGNVGIGTTNPTEPLEVNGRSKSGALTVGPWPANTNYVFVGASTLNQAAAANYALLQGATAEQGRTFLNSPVDIRFRIGNADRMVLANNGNVAMLTGSNPLNFTTGWTASPDAVTNVAEICNDTGNFKTLMIVGNRSAGMGPSLGRRVSVWDRLEVNGDLVVTGNAFKPGGGSWGPTTSDKELKKDIAPIEGALEKILRLRGVGFAWREPEKHAATSDRYLGMIAQEVEQVFPEWVKTVPSGHKGLDLVGFEALVVEALRVLATRCEKLEAELAQVREAVGKRKAATPAPKKAEQEK